MREAVVYELGVWQERVDFNLVDVWWDLGEGEDLFHAADCEVGEADGAGFAGFVDGFHAAPGWFWVVG